MDTPKARNAHPNRVGSPASKEHTMSIMRHPVYVWSDGRSMHLWARKDIRDDEGVYDPVHYGAAGESESYPGFVSGVAMPMRVWDDIVTRYAAKRDIFVGDIAAPAEVAKALVDKIRTTVLAPGEYAIVEMPDGLTPEAIDQLGIIPDDLAGRLLFVDGEVHTIKPDPVRDTQ